MARKARKYTRSRPVFWLAAAWLALLFLMGGSSRADTVSLLVLRPLSVFACAGFLIAAGRQQVLSGRWTLIVLAATFLLVGSHLLPLPPAVWQSLPQRDLVVAIDRAIGLEREWRPLSLAPIQTRNAFFALFAPLSVVFAMLALEPVERRRMILVLLSLALASVVLGILQISSGDNSPLYFYRIDNVGSPIGLFANRNHQAVFLATFFPLLAYFANAQSFSEVTRRARVFIAAGGASVLLLVLLLAGSRAGLITGAVGLASMPLIYRGTSHGSADSRQRKWWIFGGAALVLALIGLSSLASRSESLDRLVETNDAEEYRVATFETLVGLTRDYLPLGSGIGSFVETYQRAEPDSFLEPRYFNHAHNDFIEIALTGGLPAIAIALFAVALLALTALGNLRADLRCDPNAALRRAALVALAIFFLASAVDYPLRTPSLLGYAALLFLLAVDLRKRELS